MGHHTEQIPLALAFRVTEPWDIYEPNVHKITLKKAFIRAITNRRNATPINKTKPLVISDFVNV